MKKNYRVVVLITLLMLILSLMISFVNYTVALRSMQQQLKTQSLPLSLDNIYTEIQKHIIEPYLVSSMMANDTFVKDWLLHDEDNVAKITQYLDMVKNKYGMFATFLVSEQSRNYYTHNGLLEKISPDNPTNEWYFRFKETQTQHEINLDFNENLTNSLMMFINFKILDNSYHYIGATGVALKISYVDEMLRMFRQKYHLKVFFVNKKGDVVLTETHAKVKENIGTMPTLSAYKDRIMTREPTLIEFEDGESSYLLNSKYIPELDLYLIVEAKLDDFVQEVQRVFYFNLSISLLLTLVVTSIVVIVIRKYQNYMDFLADHDALTGIPNRRYLTERFNYMMMFYERQRESGYPMHLIFLDIDNFKRINDAYGHDLGDRVLVRVAELIRGNIRKSDFVARWGGEEFVVLLIGVNEEEALGITQKLRLLFENDMHLIQMSGRAVTASFGLSPVLHDDTIEGVVLRADTAMYQAKEAGKNRVEVAAP